MPLPTFRLPFASTSSNSSNNNNNNDDDDDDSLNNSFVNYSMTNRSNPYVPVAPRPTSRSYLTPYVNSNINNPIPYIDNTFAPNLSMDLPGAYSVIHNTPSSGSRPQIYRVTVPHGVIPGNEFTAQAGNRRVRVVCPVSSSAGELLQITLPPESVTSRRYLVAAPLTRTFMNANGNAGSDNGESDEEDHLLRGNDSNGTGGAVEMLPEIIAVNRAATSNKGTNRTYVVTVPDNINPGDKFRAMVNGQQFIVTCPANVGPGMKVRIVATTGGIHSSSNKAKENNQEAVAAPKLQIFQVVVPKGVRPNQPFTTVLGNGQSVLVTCPPNVNPGSKVKFQLPVTKTRLAYKDDNGSSGWERAIRPTDMKFQWIQVVDEDNQKKDYVESTNSVKNSEAIDFGKMAYVRKIQYLEGNDTRMRTGSVTLVPAQEAVVDSSYVDKNYLGTNQARTLISHRDIENVQSKCLDKKVEWFRKNICQELFRPWEQGHIEIVVRRHAFLEDSVNAILALGRNDMRKTWHVKFSGEPGMDAGGLTREWFELVTEQIFDPDFGLWLSSENNQMSMTINPASHISHPDNYLKYFRFLGRVIGRALFDGQLIKGRMARHIYKHLLGWPITFEDLKAQDKQYYTSMQKLSTMKEDLSLMCLDFTVTEKILGVRKEFEMVPGGSTMEVNSANLPQYLETNLKYRMLNRCKSQITELMLGFLDIIPEPALTVFDPNELELVLCGLPTIDVDDWMNNTKYSGYYEAKGSQHQVVEWFWEVVREDFDQDMKARLLQFVTGTSGVSSYGFSGQGNGGDLYKFCINGVSHKHNGVYPRAHTCFNRIDLPNYSSKQELRERVGQALSLIHI